MLLRRLKLWNKYLKVLVLLKRRKHFFTVLVEYNNLNVRKTKYESFNKIL